MIRSILFLVFVGIQVSLSAQAFKINPIERDSALNVAPYKIISQIQLIGNKRTKSRIISRELTFKVGDTLKNESFFRELKQSKKNILNTSLFNFSKIDVALIDSVHASIIVHLTERWYIIPLPIFEIDDNNFNTWLEETDYNRINYGLNLTDYNFRGRNERLSLTAKYGFTERFRLAYTIPYIDKKQKIGLGFDISTNRREQVVYSSRNNKRLQLRTNEDALKNYVAGVGITIRNKIFNRHSFGVNYNSNRITDTLFNTNENFLGHGQTAHRFFSLFYTYSSDLRDSRNYPLKGHYLKFNIVKYGLGISNNDIDLTNFQLQYKRFIELEDRLFLAGSIRGVVAATNDQPYILQNGLGYNSSFGIRSYELYVIDGQNIGLFKAQIKYQLVKPRVVNIRSFPKKFEQAHFAMYLGLFSDLGYVEDNTGFPENNLANELQFGTGIGLDFVSYYDIVIRTEFSINKFGDSGLFLHFVAPI